MHKLLVSVPNELYTRIELFKTIILIFSNHPQSRMVVVFKYIFLNISFHFSPLDGVIVSLALYWTDRSKGQLMVNNSGII